MVSCKEIFNKQITVVIGCKILKSQFLNGLCVLRSGISQPTITYGWGKTRRTLQETLVFFLWTSFFEYYYVFYNFIILQSLILLLESTFFLNGDITIFMSQWHHSVSIKQAEYSDLSKETTRSNCIESHLCHLIVIYRKNNWK